MPVLEQANLVEMRKRHPDWIWNRSDTHVFLGVPGSHDAYRTPVEPGNSFSPGPGTYGVSTWVSVDGRLHAPEEKPLAELPWSFLDGHIPILTSRWRAGQIAVASSLFADGDVDRNDIKDYLSVELENPTGQPLTCTLYLVVRSFGAGGGPIKSLAFDDGRLLVNDAPLIYPDQQPARFGALSYADTGQDISVALRAGRFPADTSVEDSSTWASGALEYAVRLEPGERRRFDWAFHVHAGNWMLDWLRPPDRPLDVESIQADFAERWRALIPLKLDLPDRRFADALLAQVTHTYLFTVMDSPRTTPVTYPLWWLRDGCYQVITLDKAGLHDWAGRSCQAGAYRDVMTGFGAEADAPGELIWMISEHYLLTRSRAFLEEMYPFVQRKAELIMQMRRTTTPIKLYNEFLTSEWGLNPATEVVCRAAKDGLIDGRMDWHFPTYWVNGFSYLGLTRAAMCARELGRDGSRFEREAAELRTALRGSADDIFGQNERDTVCAIWPSEWASPDDALIRERFETWWNTQRCPGGEYTPERLWTYFEVGQAHNYMLLGQRDRTWVTIEQYLTQHTAPGLYTYPEGRRDENSALMLWDRVRGWDQRRYATPAGWTAAELFLLLRNCLLREEGDTLVLGSGVPASWLDRPFAVEGFPTYFGAVSFSYDPAARRVDVTVEHEPPGGIRADFSAPVELRDGRR